MRPLLLLLAFGLSPIILAAPAAAQTSVTGPDAVVTGENRITCRRVTRTATRMRTGRFCRTQAQWARDNGTAPNPNDPNATIDGAADTLEMGGEKVSTNCVGADLSNPGMNGRTPLGPR